MNKWTTEALEAAHTNRHLDDLVTSGKLYIIRGAPGSGKSTYAEQLVEAGYADVYFEADQFRYNKWGEYVFDPTETASCHQKCQAAVKEALLAGKDVAVANTFTKLWEIQPYLNMGASSISVVRMTYEFQNLHNVPSHVVEGMKEHYQPFDGEHVYD